MKKNKIIIIFGFVSQTAVICSFYIDYIYASPLYPFSLQWWSSVDWCMMHKQLNLPNRLDAVLWFTTCVQSINNDEKQFRSQRWRLIHQEYFMLSVSFSNPLCKYIYKQYNRVKRDLFMFTQGLAQSQLRQNDANFSNENSNLIENETLVKLVFRFFAGSTPRTILHWENVLINYHVFDSFNETINLVPIRFDTVTSLDFASCRTDLPFFLHDMVKQSNENFNYVPSLHTLVPRSLTQFWRRLTHVIISLFVCSQP